MRPRFVGDLTQFVAVTNPSVEVGPCGCVGHVEPDVVIARHVRNRPCDFTKRGEHAADAVVLMGDVPRDDRDVGAQAMDLGGQGHDELSILGVIGMQIGNGGDSQLD